MVHRASGDDSNVLKWVSWDVSALIGQQAQLRAVDEGGSAWGHLVLDHIVMGDAPVLPPNLADVTLWADHGRDFYAPISFANMQDGRVLWLGLRIDGAADVGRKARAIEVADEVLHTAAAPQRTMVDGDDQHPALVASASVRCHRAQFEQFRHFPDVVGRRARRPKGGARVQSFRLPDV